MKLSLAAIAILMATASSGSAADCEVHATNARQIVQRTSYIMDITREAETKGGMDYDKAFGFQNLTLDNLLLDLEVLSMTDQRCHVYTEIVVGRDRLTAFMNARREHFRSGRR
jgi:hypothetical protein